MFKIYLAIAAHKSQLLVAVWSSEDVLCVPSASRRPEADPDRTEGIICTRGPPTSGRSRSGHRNGATTKKNTETAAAVYRVGPGRVRSCFRPREAARRGFGATSGQRRKWLRDVKRRVATARGVSSWLLQTARCWGRSGDYTPVD